MSERARQIQAMRQLVTREVARILSPQDARVGREYASAWTECVRAFGGDSRGLHGAATRLALRRLDRVTGLAMAHVA